VLSPSSARYHWLTELVQWLGGKKKREGKEKSNNNNNKSKGPKIKEDVNPLGRMMQKMADKKRRATEQLDNQRKNPRSNGDDEMTPSDDDDDEDDDLLREDQINVITKGKDNLFPTKDTRVVICSYGLATNLIQTGTI